MSLVAADTNGFNDVFVHEPTIAAPPAPRAAGGALRGAKRPLEEAGRGATIYQCCPLPGRPSPAGALEPGSPWSA